MPKQEKLVLVIEGGGFKSVFSAGVLDKYKTNQMSFLLFCRPHGPKLKFF